MPDRLGTTGENKIPKAKTESKRPSKQARTDSIGRSGGGGGDGVDDMLPQ